MKIKTYAVNCNDAWLNTEGDDISGSYVKYKDHQEVVSALEAKCAALAAEKETFAVECAAAKIAIAYLKSGRQGFSLNTPATDAFLDEVRAQGVEMFAGILKVAGVCEHPYLDAANDLAAKLRNEASSTMLQGSLPEADNTNQQFESLGRGDK